MQAVLQCPISKNVRLCKKKKKYLCYLYDVTQQKSRRVEYFENEI